MLGIKVLFLSMGFFLVLENANAKCPSLLDYSMPRLAVSSVDNLCDTYRDKVILVVNTASKCGFTGQFDELEQLHESYKDKDFSVIGFPSDDFGQELKDEKQILDFCRLTYSVQFPMYSKVRVKKDVAHPFFTALATAAGGKYPRWNFYKYLIGKDGKLVSYYNSLSSPTSSKIVNAIEKEIRKPFKN